MLDTGSLRPRRFGPVAAGGSIEMSNESYHMRSPPLRLRPI